MAGIPRPRQKPPDHRYLSRQEVALVYAACRSDENRLIVRLLLLGLRSVELRSLTWADWHGDELRVRSAKRGKPRRVWLDAETMRLMESRRATGPIVPLSYEGLRSRMAALSRKSGVTVRLHDWRRTFASHMALAGMNLTSIQELGGWSSSKYAAYYARSALQEAALSDARRLDLTARLLSE